MKLTAINKFPVKSLKAIGVDSVGIDDFGIINDRRWMLTDESGKFLTQRRYPLMGAISVSEITGGLSFDAPGVAPLSVMMSEFSEEVSVQVWSDSVAALKAGASVNSWFSQLFEQSVQLVYMPESTFRQVEPEYVREKKRVGFADAYPFLLISEASLVDLNARLEKSVPMSRFRPNLVISGCAPYDEDKWRRLRIGDIEFELVKPCSRCIMTTIDERTLKVGKEPLKTLATYRKNEFGVCFGQNLIHQNIGNLTVGDSVEILA